MYEDLKKYIEESDNIVFFSGAGVSMESGVPDFKSKNELYDQYDCEFKEYEPEDLLSEECLYYNPKLFYEFYRKKLDTRSNKPSITHQVLAKLEEKGKVQAVITRNIDGLHQRAGSKNVIELHGTIRNNYCNKCKKKYPQNYIFESMDAVPRCKCGGQIRPDIILHDEFLPVEAIDEAVDAVRNADMLIVGGSSLHVFPDPMYVSYFNGKHFVAINGEKIDILFREDHDLMIIDSVENVFREISKWY